MYKCISISREKSKIEICNFDRHTTSGQQRLMFLWGGTNQKKLYTGIYIFGTFSTFELFVCFSLFQNNAFSDSLGTIKYSFFCIHLYMKSTLAQTPESNVEGLWLFHNCFKTPCCIKTTRSSDQYMEKTLEMEWQLKKLKKQNKTLVDRLVIHMACSAVYLKLHVYIIWQTICNLNYSYHVNFKDRSLHLFLSKSSHLQWIQ